METHVGFYFKKISEKLEKRANEDGKKRDITYSQGKILWYLHKHEGEKVTMREIEKFFDCSHATVSGLVSRLAQKGYVDVVRNESDKREKIVKTTKKENESFQNMKERRGRMEEKLLQGFSNEEKAEFSVYLDRVYKNLDETGF